ncbi:hypothetical protein CERSUDRAFT_87213 [Gelatoporia subvermispora B]|uniref:Uncharacterized protein n=1 Tax=Ceriporiopsis subvermispora (strain B) TaxID=914234 RepID=M2PCC7_CERS8|nr:hypothetical protein CERSUDRAFT_87213 [Gelatoporia subvermispora B]
MQSRWKMQETCDLAGIRYRELDHRSLETLAVLGAEVDDAVTNTARCMLGVKSSGALTRHCPVHERRLTSEQTFVPDADGTVLSHDH